MSEIYDKLRQRFDSMASGFPETSSGSEINLLKLLYNEGEAALFVGMTQVSETPRQAARRLQKDEKSLAAAVGIYGMDGFLKSLTSAGVLHQRSIPINTDIVNKWPVAPFDDAIAIIEQQRRWLSSSVHAVHL